MRTLADGTVGLGTVTLGAAAPRGFTRHTGTPASRGRRGDGDFTEDAARPHRRPVPVHSG